MATMAIEVQRQPACEAKSPAQVVPPLRRPSVIDTMRAFSVVYGPSIVADLLVAMSANMLLRRALGRRTRCPLERRLFPLAALGVGLAVADVLAIRPHLRRWGATADEAARPLPGDELVPEPAINATWSVTIDAPVEEVWPWLAQIGQDRGGFYSYAWLENLAGCRLRNAEKIYPAWQQRTIGEVVPLHPAVGLPVQRFEPGHALVLSGWGPFVVEPIDAQHTRLISRSRVPKGWQALSYVLLLEIPHFIMQREMLLGIKRRAERARRTVIRPLDRPSRRDAARPLRGRHTTSGPPRV
jgi:hypothetical protein